MDGIRIFSRAGVTVEDCEFSGLGGIAVAANFTSGHGIVVRGNVIQNSGATALPPARNGVRLAGNRDCSLLACFMNPEGRDFSPLLGAGLVGAGAVRVELWVPGDDYLGNRRGIPPTVGALERPAGPIPLAPKP